MSVGLGNVLFLFLFFFFNTTPKAQTVKQKSTHGTTSDTNVPAQKKKQLTKGKETLQDGGKDFANHVSDKRICKIGKKFTELNNRKTNTSN